MALVNRLIGIGHGLAWKLAALAAKLGFVLLLLPQLHEQVFAQYSFLTSAALLASLVLSFGVMDALPPIVRGRLVARNLLSPLVYLSFVGTFAMLAFYVMGAGSWALVAATAGCSIAYFALAGVLRSTEPHLFEIISNAPSVLFLLLALFWSATTIDHLLLAFFVANMSVLVAVAVWVGLPFWPSLRSLRYSSAIFAKLITHGNAKTLANVLMLGNFRALIAVPGFLGKLPSDQLAVALTIGEAFWQIGAVATNRNYAHYCRGEGTIGYSSLIALGMMMVVAIFGALVVLVPIPLSIAKFDWPTIGWAIIFFAAMLGLTELRNFFWSRGVYDWNMIGLQLGVLAVQAAIVLLIPPLEVLPTVALCVLTIAVVTVLVVRFKVGDISSLQSSKPVTKRARDD